MLGWILSQLLRAARAVLELLGLVSGAPGLEDGTRGPRVLVKAGDGRTVGLELRAGWTVRDVKAELSSRLGGLQPHQLRIIFAGRELPDSLPVQNCDLGNQSVLHAVTVINREESQAPAPAPDTALAPAPAPAADSGVELAEDQRTPTERLAMFFCWCSEQDLLAPAKLRVRCEDCGDGAILLHSEPASWEDVLSPGSIQGHCQLCQKVSRVTFYFRCGSERHRGGSQGSDGHEAQALDRVRTNTNIVECLACGDLGETVVVFRCDHVTCTSCFTDYSRSRLADRQFLLHPELGYTLRCPLGCEDSELTTAHFRLLGGGDWARYLTWGAEELVLQSGGVLCPQPGCGAGILAQPSPHCRTIGCVDCGFVFCRDCREGAHLGDCLPCMAPLTAEEPAQSSLAADRAAVARWSGADPSSLTIRVMTKPCPGCRTPTERDGGCMHMICTKPGCGLHWCWVCQLEWTRDCMASHWFG